MAEAPGSEGCWSWMEGNKELEVVRRAGPRSLKRESSKGQMMMP